MLQGAFSTHRLLDLGEAEAARKRRKENSGKVVQKYGEFYTYQVRRQIEQDEDKVSVSKSVPYFFTTTVIQYNTV
jgi:hypothetical protein